MKPVPRLFLDASVWIAAAGSTTGGSAATLELCRRNKTRAVASRFVLLEAERNIRKKLGREALLRFYREIASLEIKVIETPTSREIAAQNRTIDSKDAHVLAAAVKSHAEFLLTLDRKDFMTSKVLHAGLPFQIMTPGDFLRFWLEKQT
ncbi:MAG: putative toxin-antitoxin system toxin component, PIN family [Nitrospirae bacterium]|nr:putative toxin-antitoxin system toxin component, PIN family [Nitrospirota bacterium]